MCEAGDMCESIKFFVILNTKQKQIERKIVGYEREAKGTFKDMNAT